MPPPGATRRILFSAGDVSGDLHGAALAARLRERRGDLELAGLGGRAMQAAGVELLASSDALAIGGLVEVLRALGAVRATRRALLEHARAHPPDLVVLIDSGGFNLPLARALRRSCEAKILYFVAPQVWAWRRGRIRKLARRVDRAAVILPFEAEHYAGTGLTVDFVGHPLVDEFAVDGAAGSETKRSAARARLGVDAGARVVALMPGSRRNEVDAHLPMQLEAVARLRERWPDLRALVAVAPSIDRGRIDALVAAAPGEVGAAVRVVEGDSRGVLRAADAALLKPGTVTTEAMLLGVPMVVMARAHPLTAAVVRRLLRVPHLAMPNLVAGRRIVPEYWQEEATPGGLADALAGLLGGPEREAQLAALGDAAQRLGPGGAIDRAADVALSMLDER